MEVAVGRKIEMTQLFEDSGKQVPVTKIEIIPLKVSQIRTNDRDGYQALQLETQGDHQYCQEFRLLATDEEKLDEINEGDEIDIKDLADSKNVSVAGFTKGKGFQGAIKRHGFSRGPMSHGGNHHRRTGAIGQCVIPSRVFKNKKMPGQMGNTKITIKNLQVIKIKDNYLYLKGSVPGPNGNYLTIRG